MILRRLLRDRFFLLALSLGPVFWWLNSTYGFSYPVDDFSWRFLLLAVLVLPVLEELAFRGAVQGGLLCTELGRRKFFSLSVANGLGSLLFAFFHLYAQSVLWSIAVFFPSLLFGFMRDRHGSVVPSIVLHSFYNLGFFWCGAAGTVLT